MEEIFVPASGMAMEEVVLSEWLKQPGEHVEAGDVIALVETDKATVELSGQTSGRLSRHLVSAGDHVRGGTTVAYLLGEGEVEDGAGARARAGGEVAGEVDLSAIGADDDTVTVLSPTGEPSEAAASGPGEATALPAEGLSVPHGPAATPSAMAKDAEGRYRLSPRRRRELLHAGPDATAGWRSATPFEDAAPREPVTAPQHGVPAAAGVPTPPDGLAPTGRAAVPARGEPADAGASSRRATAELVSESWRTVPHFSLGREIRAEGLLASLARARAEGVPATATDFMVRALGRALEDIGERPDVGLAVATPWGVLIPVVRAVPGRSLGDLAAQRQAAVDRARQRRLGAADAAAPFATLSNLGPHGVQWFTGVVPLGQAALLTVGQIGPRPAVEGRGLVVAQMFTAVLTADHRRYDGVDSARLLAGFVEHLPSADVGEG
jgi:pyruvate dehydrogenase E2 component (dihydrolipoamide acetyltransferase)